MKRLKRPKSVNILGRKFKVREISAQKVKELTGEPGSIAGLCYSDKLIVITKDMSDEDYLLSLLHEIKHAINFTTGINQSMGSQLLECDCESSASGYYDLIKQMFL